MFIENIILMETPHVYWIFDREVLHAKILLRSFLFENFASDFRMKNYQSIKGSFMLDDDDDDGGGNGDGRNGKTFSFEYFLG